MSFPSPLLGFWTNDDDDDVKARRLETSKRRIPIDYIRVERRKREQKKSTTTTALTNQQARRRADPKQRLASRGDDRDGDGEHRDQETAVLQQNAFDERFCHFFLRRDVSFVVFFAQCFFTY